MSQITPQSSTEPFVSVAEAAKLLGLSVAETDELLRRNLIERRTLVLLSSVREYQATVR